MRVVPIILRVLCWWEGLCSFQDWCWSRCNQAKPDDKLANTIQGMALAPVLQHIHNAKGCGWTIAEPGEPVKGLASRGPLRGEDDQAARLQRPLQSESARLGRHGQVHPTPRLLLDAAPYCKTIMSAPLCMQMHPHPRFASNCGILL